MQDIALKVNKLQKPIFNDIESFRRFYKKINQYNNQFPRWMNERIELESFINQFHPSSTELKEKIWAVHAAKILPNEELKPFLTVRGSEVNHTPLDGFSNTVHFSLGSLVTPHENGSWENHLYAIITPLKNIADQIDNIFVHDTFLRGNWKLTEDTILLVPNGTDTSQLKGKFQVIYYDKSQETLRNAIQRIIKEKNGLVFESDKGSLSIGDPARLDQININTSTFFQNLLDEKKGKLSFGTHTTSEIGHAGLLGLLRIYSMELLHFKKQNSDLTYLHYVLLSQVFSEAKEHNYLNDDEIAIIEKMLNDSKDLALSIKEDWKNKSISGDTVFFLDLEKVKDFQKNYPYLCPPNSHFLTEWAIMRWIFLGYEKGLKEGLDKIIKEDLLIDLAPPKNLNRIDDYAVLNQNYKNKLKIFPGFNYFKKILDEYSKKDSQRKKVVDAIVALPEMRVYRKIAEWKI